MSFSGNVSKKGGIMKKLMIVFAVLVFAACGQQQTAQDYFDSGVRLFEKGELDKAILDYEQGLKLAPRSAVGHNLFGMACRFKFSQTADPEWRKKEIACFEEALKINPDFMPALANLGATYYYAGEKEKAIPHFKRVLEVQQDHPEAEEIKKMIAEAEGPQSR
jgi:tetratricopeptide (TPR) repeat protein